MALELEKILGTDSAKEAFYKTDRNFQKIDEGIENIDGNIDVSEYIQAHDTSETSHSDIREQINDLRTDVGDKTTLITTDKTNLVNAVNENRAQINSLDANKVDNSRVLTDVPVNAKFTDTVYTHPTTAGNKHIPAGGAANQYLKYSASGTAVWSDLGDAPSVNGKSIWVGPEESRGTDANTIYFCY